MGFEYNMFNKPFEKHYSLFGGGGLCYDRLGVGSEEQAFALYMAIKNSEKGYLLDKFMKTREYKEIDENYPKIYNKYFSVYDNFATPVELADKAKAIFEETFNGSFKIKDFRLKKALTAAATASIAISTPKTAN